MSVAVVFCYVRGFLCVLRFFLFVCDVCVMSMMKNEVNMKGVIGSSLFCSSVIRLVSWLVGVWNVE